MCKLTPKKGDLVFPSMDGNNMNEMPNRIYSVQNFEKKMKFVLQTQSWICKFSN